MTNLEKVQQTIFDMVQDIEDEQGIDYTPRSFVDKDGNDCYLSDYLEEYFEGNIFIHQYSIEDCTCFSSPGYDCGIISIAFITSDSELGQIIINWETK